MQIEFRPGKAVDVGAGKGTPVTREVRGGVVGLMLDARGRPLQLPADREARVTLLKQWHDAINLYPKMNGTRH